jgi:protein-S-isoprenylcysteine O-methyltransferase Ste14
MTSNAATTRTRWHIQVAFAGGGLFVVSLLYGLVSYVRNFGAPADLDTGPIAPSLVTNALLFTIFAAHHSLLARPRARGLVERFVPPALERVSYVIVASVLFIAVCAMWRPVPGTLWHIQGWAAWPMAGLQVFGVVASISASRRLDIFSLAGIRQARGEASAPRGLISDGWYGLVRHPIYFGWMLMVWPAPHLTATRAAFAAISSAYLLLAIPIEERALRRTFGMEYEDYARRVRWKVIPYLY